MSDTVSPLVVAMTSPKTGKPLVLTGMYHSIPKVLVLPDADAESFRDHFEGVSIFHSDGTPYMVASASSVGLTDEHVTPADLSA